MLIKKYEFDWYEKFRIKLINSICSCEGYGGKKFHNKEYCFNTNLYPGSVDCHFHIINVNIPYILQMFEKLHLLNNGKIPEVLKFMIFNGITNKINISEMADKIANEFNESILDAQIVLMVEAAWEKFQSIIFQRRIPWELKLDDNGTYSVYGRFTTGII